MIDKLSIGVDIEEISRFKELNFSKKKSFYLKIFSKKEIDYCLSKHNPYVHFAVRFCAKEAAIKAMKSDKILLSEIEIIMKDNVPEIILPRGKKGLVSMSHTKNHAISFVLIYE